MSRPQSTLRRYVFELFVLNEQINCTDESLAYKIEKAFKLSGILNQLRFLRSDFNTGRLGVPPCMSFKYNSLRQACRYTCRPFSAEEFQQKLRKFRFKDERCLYSVGSQTKE